MLHPLYYLWVEGHVVYLHVGFPIDFENHDYILVDRENLEVASGVVVAERVVAVVVVVAEPVEYNVVVVEPVVVAFVQVVAPLVAAQVAAHVVEPLVAVVEPRVEWVVAT